MSVILLFTVFAAVDPFYRICQNKYLFQLLLNRGDTSRVFAADYVVDSFGRDKVFFSTILSSLMILIVIL